MSLSYHYIYIYFQELKADIKTDGGLFDRFAPPEAKTKLQDACFIMHC